MRCAEHVAGKKINFRNSKHTMRIDTELCFFFNDVDSVVLMLYIVALFQPRSV